MGFQQLCDCLFVVMVILFSSASLFFYRTAGTFTAGCLWTLLVFFVFELIFYRTLLIATACMVDFGLIEYRNHLEKTAKVPDVLGCTKKSGQPITCKHNTDTMDVTMNAGTADAVKDNDLMDTAKKNSGEDVVVVVNHRRKFSKAEKIEMRRRAQLVMEGPNAVNLPENADAPLS